MKTVRILAVTALLVFLWLVSGYVATAGFLLVARGLSSPASSSWPLVCGLVNAVLGLALLLVVTRTRRGWRLFYQGPQEQEEGSLFIAVLWVMPIILLLVGGVWWLIYAFLRITK